MVPPTILAPLGVLLVGAKYAMAIERISIAAKVKADTDTEVKITNDLGDGAHSFDAGFTDYNLYLSTTPPGWGTGPVCLLANGTKIDTTSVTIKIPADAVPSDAVLHITAMEWNSDPNKDGPSGYVYSSGFTLDGGKAEWGESELNGHGIGYLDMTPCSAYACGRDCADKNYVEVPEDPNDDNTIKKYNKASKAAYECIAKCPGTTYPPWEAVHGDSGDDDDDSESSAEPSGTSTKTATSTSSGVSKTASATDASETSGLTGTTSATASATSATESAAAGHVVATSSTLFLIGVAAAYSFF